MRLLRVALCFSFCGTLVCGCIRNTPVKTARKPVLTNYHGVAVTDHYQWLERGDDPAVRGWAQKQHAATRKYLDALPARAPLEHEFRRLFDHVSSEYSGLRVGGGRVFCLRFKPPARQAMLVQIAPALNARGILLDPNQLDTNGTIHIDFFQPSLDGKFVAVSLSTNGTGAGTLYVYEVATKRRLPDVVPRVHFPSAGGSVAWDEQGFYYTRYVMPEETAEANPRLIQHVYYHRLGAPEAQDRYEVGREFSHLSRITLQTGPDRRHLLLTLAHGAGAERAHWLRPPTGTWRQITRVEDGVERVEFGRDPLYVEWPADDSLYLLSHQNAPRGRILKMPLSEPDLRRARVVIQEGDTVIRAFVPSATGLMIEDSDGGPSEVRFHDFYAKTESTEEANEPNREMESKDDDEPPDEEDEEKVGQQGEETATAPPEPPSRRRPRGSDRKPRREWKLGLRKGVSVQEAVCVRGDLLLFRAVGFTQPSMWLFYEPSRDRDRIHIAPFGTISPVEFSDVETVWESALSKDGTKVPLSILRRKGTRLNGQNPVLLTGAGNFGVSLTPGFDFTRRVWLDQGGVLAFANVRGGGEYGDSWHRAGSLTNKQNAFDDFIACAEFLIRSNYTNPGRLAIEGASHGGALIGAALTQRPDLFRGVIAEAGLFDMLRSEQDANGEANLPEFGSVAVPDQFRALHAYSPYHHVTNRMKYPGVLLLASREAEPVNPAHSWKMAARLQAASASRQPVLLSTASNKGSSPSLDERLARLVDVYSFLFDQLGLEYSQVARGPWVGAVTPTTAVVKARLAREGLNARLALSTSALLTRPKFSLPLRTATNHNNVVGFPLEQLRPDTQYYYALEVDGRLDRARRGQFRTFPANEASFSFAFASCARTASTSGVFDTIRENRPLFYMNLGDFHYENIRTNDLVRFRSAYDRVLFSPQQGDLYRSTPFVYIWDDHDFGGNNANRRAGSHEVARTAYDLYVPHYPLPAGTNGPIYQSFTVGRVKFILTDLRSERDPATNRDDAKKSMMGAAQKQWFKNELLTANGRYPLICWVSSVPWIGAKGSNYYRVATNVYGYLHHTTLTNVPSSRTNRSRERPPGSDEDHWSVYATERREIADFIKSNHIRGVCILHGDSHMLAADDGSNSDYATGGGAPIPVMCGGPLDQRASLKGGPYSQGVYRVNFLEGEGAFAWMTVADRHEEIELRYSGRTLRNEEKVALHFKVPARGRAHEPK